MMKINILSGLLDMQVQKHFFHFFNIFYTDQSILIKLINSSIYHLLLT